MKRINLLLALMVFICWANAATYLVQPGGTGASWNGVTGTVVDLTTQGQSLNQWYAATTLSAGDQIWLIKGNYTLTDSIVTKTTEKIYGGFAGTEQTIADRAKGTNAWDFTNETIIDGGNLVRGIVSTTGSTIDGLSIQNCAFPLTSVGTNAAAVKITTASILQNCIVRNNTITGPATAGGIYSGGVYLTTGAKLLNSFIHDNSCANTGGGGNGGGVTICQLATLDGCTISNNTAYNSGGGVNILAKLGGALVNNCIITNNTTTNGSGGGLNVGSGLAFTAGLSLTISNCTISSNTGKSNGGGISMDVTNTTSWESNPIYITKCTISSNSTSGTTGSTGNGGGIYLLRGIFNVNGCTINNNVSNSNTTTDNNGGGGIFIPYSAGTALYLLNSTLKGNVIGTGKNVGSAINTDIQSTLVRNCLITGNTGSTFHTQGAARQCTYQNCTLAGNVTSTGSEAGLNLGWQVGAISTFTNCIFYKSSTNPISGTINANMDPVVMYCGFDLAAVPATYATKTGCITGLTAASFTDAANGDWSLSPTSAAINAGTTIPAVTTDISGTNLRPQGSAYDMGAYETPSAISSFTPTSGASGATVTITGSNLTGTTAVSFGGVAASSFTVNSDTQITATVGLGGTGNVSVTTPGGIGTLAGFTCTGYLPAPVITLFSPTTGASNTTVTITGLNLTGATAVSFGGTAAKSFTVNSDTKITAVTNSASVGIVSVTTPSGTASLGVPTITSFTPTTAGNGASVVITGTYLTGTSVVKFGGTAPISYIVNSDTQITATVGSTVSGSVSVTTPLGTGTLAGFTYSSPVISSFTPPVGGSGNSVVITGTGFTGVTAVSFGGTAATTYNIDSDTQITATVGASASGSVTVSTAIGTNSKSGFTWISSPTIYKAGTATAFTTTYGTTSTIQSFTVGGVRLTANVTATAPAGFEVSSDGTTYGSTATFTQTSGYASGTLRIRLTASAGVSGTYNAKNIVLSSTSATAVNITTAASGNAVSAKALTITATGPTKIYGTALSVGTSTSNFTTNGAEVSGETVTSITLTPDAAGLSATTAVGAPYVVTPSLATGTGSFLASNYNVTYNVYNGTVSAVPPTITSFTPTTAGSGTSVVITGTNLTAASAVSFGGTAATSFVVNSATQITAVVGSGSTGSVSVTTPGGTATKTGFSSTVTGIENTEDANLSLSVYKNATGQIIVNRDGTIGSEGMITIYNVMGNKLVHICTTGKMTVINNSFGSGIYLVSIDVAGKNITRKVIIH